MPPQKAKIKTPRINLWFDPRLSGQNRSKFKASCGVFRDGGNVYFPYGACLVLPGLAT
jgi:hypothetical protein